MAKKHIYQHPPETKEKVLAALKKGESGADVAAQYGVHISTVYAWSRGGRKVVRRGGKKDAPHGSVKHAIIFLKRARDHMEQPLTKSDLYALLALDALGGL